MSETPPSEEDADLEREIRSGRKFTLSEALGRMAGGSVMKGASPVTLERQAELEVEEYLRRHLIDAGGVLVVALFRSVRASELWLNNYQQPLVVLASHIQGVLGSEYRLKELVREADIEWGRAFGERPHFQKEGCLSHPDDPYTDESVRMTLSQLIEKLAAGET